MSVNSRHFAPLLVAVGAATSITVAPIAAADSVLPQPGYENARDTINDLAAQGYDNVQINWVNGIPRVPLEQCWVNGINTAGAAQSLRTVYVDIECPST